MDYGPYIISISAITAVLVQLIKTTLIDPHMADASARLGVIHSLTILINFGLLIAVLVTKGAFDWSNFIDYIGIALAQWGGSAVSYTVLSTGSSPQPGPLSTPANSGTSEPAIPEAS